MIARASVCALFVL